MKSSEQCIDTEAVGLRFPEVHETGDVDSSVVSESGFYSEDPGFDPLTGQGEGQSFCPSESTFVQTCLCLTPPSSVRHALKYVRTLKIPYPSVAKG